MTKINGYHIRDAKALSGFVPKGVDLIVSSPPYFDMKDYGASGQIGFGQSWDSYMHDMATVFVECGKVARQTSSMWLIVDTLKREGSQLLLPFHLAQAAEKGGWHLHETIIWKKDRTLPFSAKGEMRNIFEYVLFFVRGSEFKYHPERVKSYDFKQWWVKYPERYSVTGKAPTDVWEFPIPVQGSWGSHYVRHFCPLPEGLVTRIIDLCSDPGDLVLDPFAGSGAVLAAAYRSNRKFIGLDVNPEFKAMFEDYLPTLSKREADTSELETGEAVASTIGKLRLLKYPSAILKAVRKAFPDEFAAIDGVTLRVLEDQPRGRHAHWRAHYTFSLSAGLPEAVVDFVAELAARPPLSKYGIESEITFETIPMDAVADYSYYRWNATYLGPGRGTEVGRPFIAAPFGFEPAEERLLSRYR